MNCKNCNKPLKNTQRFCDECGAKVIQNRLTPKILATQVNEEFISIDNKFLRTFVNLFKKPEDVINGYIDGTRKKYINVIQYFAISLTLAGIQVFLMNTFFKEALDTSSELVNGFNSSLANKDNPFSNIDFNDFSKYQSLIYIAGVPLSAFSSWIVYFIVGNKRYNFTEHLVLNLYYSAQIIIITAFLSILFLILGLDYLIISSLIMLPAAVYLGYVLKDIFKESHLETFGMFLFMMIIYSILYLGLMFIFVLFKVIIDNNGSL